MLVSAGGLAWLAGVLILETTIDSVDDDLPVSFLLLAVLAGTLVALGTWKASSGLERRSARVGMGSVAVCSAILGIGFGLDAFPGMFLGFLLSYTVGLFALPAAFLVLGLGVARSLIFPGWGKWIPFAVFATAAVTYGFHALAREVWDPADAVWFGALGVGWVLLGVAISAFDEADLKGQTPEAPLTATPR
jgi:hypothetical protein